MNGIYYTYICIYIVDVYGIHVGINIPFRIGSVMGTEISGSLEFAPEFRRDLAGPTLERWRGYCTDDQLGN